MRQTGFQQAFNVGELGPDAWSRSDLAQHSKGCVLAWNMIGRVAGPMGRRPGTWYCGAPKHQDKAGRLLPFRRSAGDALLLEFGHQYARVWDVNGAPVMDGSSQVEFATPWTEAQLEGLRYKQVGDVMWFVHQDGLRMQTLARSSNTSWAITPTLFVDGPWRPENADAGKTLTLSGSTLSASGHAPFTAQHVGALFRLRKNDGNPGMLSWEPEEQDIPNLDRRLSNGRVYTRTGGVNDAGNTPPVHDGGTVSDGKALWAFLHDGATVVRVTAFGSSTSVTVTVLTGLVDDLDSGTYNWAEGAYSDARGWPTAFPAVREERLVLAAPAAEPAAVDFTRTAGFRPDRLDFKPGLGTGRVVDDDAVRRPVGDEQNRVVWLMSTTALIAGTTDEEVLITGATVDDPISPSGNAARSVGEYGSADVGPVLAHGGVLFVAAGGETLREVKIAPDQSMGRRDLNVVAEHIGQRGLAELTWLKQPWNLLWVRLEDGGQASFTYHAEQAVEGWNRHGLAAIAQPTPEQPLGGGLTLESSCVLPGPKGRPRLFMLVSRIKNGATQRMILRLADRADRLFLDAAESYAGASSNFVAGLNHLAGEAVTVMAATEAGAEVAPGRGWGQYEGRGVSDAGVAALPASDETAVTATAMYAGLPFLSRWEGLPPELSGPGSSAGRKIQFKHAMVMIEAAVAEVGTVGEEGDSGTDPFLSRRPSDIAGPAVRRKTWRAPLLGGTEEEKRLFVQTRSGFDMVIHAIRATADVN
jgi:hypothetical protein